MQNTGKKKYPVQRFLEHFITHKYTFLSLAIISFFVLLLILENSFSNLITLLFLLIIIAVTSTRRLSRFHFRVIFTLGILSALFLIMTLTISGLSQEFESNLSTNGTDPTEPRTRFDAFLARIEPLSAGYILQTSAQGQLAFARWGSIGMKVPLVYADFPSSVTFEIGDIQLNTLFRFYQNKTGIPFKSAAFGIDFFTNTGDVNVGTGYGQYVIAPYLTASFYPANEILIAPILEEFISLDKDDAGRKIHDISLRIKTIYTFEDIWVTLIPELIVDALRKRKSLWTLRSSIGIMVNPKSGFSADFIYQLAGEKRFEYLARINLRYLIR